MQPFNIIDKRFPLQTNPNSLITNYKYIKKPLAYEKNLSPVTRAVYADFDEKR
jgi:hypothetical protein